MPYILVAAAIFITDLLIKNKIEREKTDTSTHLMLGGKVIIRKYHNTGAMLNIGSKYRRVVAVVSFVFCIFMIFLFVVTLTMQGNHLFKLGLSFMLGGAFNNTYDRLKRKYVVDYISFAPKSPRISRVVYNISDFCILIGALLFVISQL